MDVATFQTLLTPRGQSALGAAMALAPDDADFLTAFEKLRKHTDADLAKAAVETAILRRKANEKFPDAAKLYFTRESLEQATHHVVAVYRAARFRGTVLDLGCGLGADAIALARVGCRVVAVERDPYRAAMARANVAALGLDVTVLEGDALTMDLPPVEAVFCDPARRDERGRHLASDEYAPRPRDIIERFRGVPIAFKLAPGIRHDDHESYGGEAEFLSLRGELKECCLWLGWGRSGRRATLLPGGETLAGEANRPRTIAEPGAYLYLPDAAVIRAGLVAELGLAFLDERQPLLTGDALTPTPFATAYRCDAVLQGSVSKLNAALRQRQVGRVTWMNLGSPREVESVRKAVTLRGDGHRAVMLTKIAGAATSLIVERLPSC